MPVNRSVPGVAQAAVVAVAPSRGGLGSPHKVNGFARGSPTRGAVERSETERLYEDRAFPLQESPARGIASCIFLSKFMI